MGRELSDFQKSILRLAYRNRREDARRVPGRHDAYACEVLHERFGFPLRYPLDRTTETVHLSDQFLDQDRIEGSVWKSAHTAVRGAFRRLEARGLVTVQHDQVLAKWIGITLTEDGFKEAENSGGYHWQQTSS